MSTLAFGRSTKCWMSDVLYRIDLDRQVLSAVDVTDDERDIVASDLSDLIDQYMAARSANFCPDLRTVLSFGKTVGDEILYAIGYFKQMRDGTGVWKGVTLPQAVRDLAGSVVTLLIDLLAKCRIDPATVKRDLVRSLRANTFTPFVVSMPVIINPMSPMPPSMGPSPTGTSGPPPLPSYATITAETLSGICPQHGLG